MLKETDFLSFRGALESGRQSPASLAGNMLLAIFLQALLLLLESFVGGYAEYNYKKYILEAHIWFSFILALFSIIYAFPAISLKSQKTQYLLSILVSHNLFGISFFILAILLLGIGILGPSTERNLSLLVCICIITGLIVFGFTLTHLLLRLKEGAYEEGSANYERRQKWERIPYKRTIVFSMCIFFIIQFVLRRMSMDVEILFISVLCMSIFHAMMFVLPEQLVILYCKFRFSSFNYDRRGELYPIGFDQKYESRRKKGKA